jgi:DNA-binding transcriptional MerR regulator
MSEWMTAREAAKVLHVTDRMVGHYAAQGKVQVRREGRRVWYSSDDIQKLASELRTDIRPAQITRSDVNDELIRYIQERGRHDEEFLEVQELMVKAQQETNARLARIERFLAAPPLRYRRPSWQTVATLALVLAIALVVLTIVARFF